jgi:hypothetical protein
MVQIHPEQSLSERLAHVRWVGIYATPGIPLLNLALGIHYTDKLKNY